MDKEQAVDERELVSNYVCACPVCVYVCTRACVYKSQYVVHLQTGIQFCRRSETVALYITQLYTAHRYNTALSECHLYRPVCFVLEVAEGRVRLYTAVPPQSSFCYLAACI